MAQGLPHKRTRPLAPDQLSLKPRRSLLGAVYESFGLEERGDRRVRGADGERLRDRKVHAVFPTPVTFGRKPFDDEKVFQ
jgi:hypothetical protein